MDFRFWEEQDEIRDTPPGRIEIGGRFPRTEKYKYTIQGCSEYLEDLGDSLH